MCVMFFVLLCVISTKHMGVAASVSLSLMCTNQLTLFGVGIAGVSGHLIYFSAVFS